MAVIVIAVPDKTRQAHLKTILPGIVRHILLLAPSWGAQFAGRTPEIKIIVATGLHRPHTTAELREVVGKRIYARYRVLTHTQHAKDLVFRGRTSGGAPIFLNRAAAAADAIVSVGLIEPHLYAGYSGGAKTIAIGLAGRETIDYTHHPRFLDKAGTSIGELKRNPFQQCLWEIIRGLPVRYAVNVVNDREGRLAKIFEGSLEDSFAAGTRFAARLFARRFAATCDAVICTVDHPKDANIYQASRAFNYILNVKRPVVKNGGIVLVRAALGEGYGDGFGELKFEAAIRGMGSPESLLRRVKREGCAAGEHRAYMVAQALTRARLGFIGPRAIRLTRGTPFLAFENTAAALRFIRRATPGARIRIIPHALSLIATR